MPKLYTLLLLALMASCAPDNNNQDATLQELKAIRQEVASLSDSIATLKDSLQAAKTIPTLDSTIVETPKEKPIVPPPPPPLEKPSKPATPKPVVNKEDRDTTYHKYVNGRVSVKITPWVNSERKVLFYDLLGNETYSIDEVRHSYSIRVELKFAPNGSVGLAVVHINPGASMYWYETEIKFDTDNTPISKIDHKFPQGLDDIMGEKWVYWDKKSKMWKEQEVMD